MRVAVKGVTVKRMKAGSYGLRLDWSDDSCSELSQLCFKDLRDTYDKVGFCFLL